MSVTKIGQGQIKGNGSKVDLGAELSAVELAIKNAVGGPNYESVAELNLTAISGMISKAADGKLEFDVNVDAKAHDISNISNLSANVGSFVTTHAGMVDGSTATFATTHAGALDATSAQVNGVLGVTGNSSLGGNVNVGGSVVIAGGLDVQGAMTYLETQDLRVKDAKVVIADGITSFLGGEGIYLGSEGGAHKLVWDSAANRWALSDGLKSVDFKAGGKTLVDSMGVHGHADGLKIDGAGVVQFQDQFMSGPMDLSKTGEFTPVFGAQGWAKDLGLIGALNKLRVDGAQSVTDSYADLSADIAAEIARATAAEAELAADIATEAAARAAADIAHDAAIAAEVARATAAEGQISSDLAAEIARATAAEQAISASVTAEVSRATAAELVLTNNLSAEVARATAAEGVLTNALAAEVTRATGAEAELAADIAALELLEGNHYSELDGKITTEKNRALAAELVLDGKISTEKSRAEAAELVLTNALAAEVSRAQAAEASIVASVAAETTRATAAEQAIASNLAAEVVRATAAEAALTTALSTEEAARIAGDANLQGQLNTLTGKIASQAGRIFVAVIPQGPDLAMDSDLTGYAGDEFVMPVGKFAVNYDLYLNGQQMMWNQDFVFVGGKVQFKFALKAGDVVRFREF